ncbi:hypothetical protein PG993_004422, partial [Apiospora rasikravindrae]
KRARKLLESLSTYNYSRTFNQSTRKRHGNTTNWIYETSQFQRWVEGNSSVLWCSGKIGCGKTIAAANAIRRVQQTRSAGNIPLITYLFMQTDDSDSLNTVIVLRTLLRQLLTESMVSGDIGDALHKVVLSSDESDITDLLLKLMPASQKAYIFLDGLDECKKEDRGVLLNALSTLVTAGGNIRLYISSHNSVGAEVKKYFPGFEHIYLDCQANNNDIASYINDTINEKLKQGDLKVGGNELVIEIKDSLATGAQGMYLWAYFQIEEICLQTTDGDIRQALKDLPRDLAGVFQRVLRRINDRHRGPIARKLFPSFLLDAPADSTLAEFHFVLEDVDHNIGEICITYLCFNDFKITLTTRSKPALINPLQIAPMVTKPVSKSAALLSEIPNKFTNTSHAIDLQLQASNIVSPQNLPIIETLVTSHPFLEYASKHWAVHTKYFHPRNSKTWDIWEGICAEDPAVIWACDNDHAAIMRLLLSYKPYTLDDAAFSGNLSLVNSLLNQLMAGSEIPDQIIHQAFRTAVILGRSDIVDRFLAVDILDVNSPLPPYKGQTSALAIAMQAKNPYMVNSLVVAGANTVDVHIVELINQGNTDDLCASIATTKSIATAPNGVLALKQAVKKGDLTMFDTLLAAGVDTGNTLWDAISRDRLEMVEKLISAKADTNAVGGTYGTNALTLSAEKGQLGVVKALLAPGADVNSARSFTGTPLQAAARNGHLEMVKVLLSAGADINSTESFGETPLQAAATNGHFETVKVLLSAGADTNLPRASTMSPLHAAAKQWHLEMVDALISAKAEIKKTPENDKGLTILQLAAEKGNLEVVHKLLAVIPDGKAELSKDAIWIAAREGHVEVVETLILAAGGLETNQKVSGSRPRQPLDGFNAIPQPLHIVDYIERNPIYTASRRGHLKVVNMLLAAGADVNVVDRYHWTPLKAAKSYGHGAVADRLRQAGAVVEGS